MDNADTTTVPSSRHSNQRTNSLVRPRHPQGPRTRPSTPNTGTFSASSLVATTSNSSSRAQLTALGEDIREVVESPVSTNLPEDASAQEWQSNHSRNPSLEQPIEISQSPATSLSRAPSVPRVFVESPDPIQPEGPKSPQISVNDEGSEAAVQEVKPVSPDSAASPSSPAPSYTVTQERVPSSSEQLHHEAPTADFPPRIPSTCSPGPPSASPIPSPSPSPAPASLKSGQIPALLAPPPLDFNPSTLQWKGLSLQAAQWTFTSAELQELVSRAIRASAKESFIRLIGLDLLDGAFPAELQKMEGEKMGKQAQYTFNLRRRQMLLQAMHSAVSQSATQSKPAGSSGNASGDNTSNVPSNTSGPDYALLLSLLTQLATLTTGCDRLVESLLHTSSHVAQIHKLQDVHSASALAIALRKLNASYAKRSAELVEAKKRIKVLEAEVDEGWAEAERLAGVLDTREAEEKLRIEQERELESALARVVLASAQSDAEYLESQRAAEQAAIDRLAAPREDSQVPDGAFKRVSKLDIATLGGNGESRHSSQRAFSATSPISQRNIPDTPRSPTPSTPSSGPPSPPPKSPLPPITSHGLQPHSSTQPHQSRSLVEGEEEEGEDSEVEEAVISHAEKFSMSSPLTPSATVLRMKKSQPYLNSGLSSEGGDAVLVPEVVPWSAAASSLHAKTRTLSEGSANNAQWVETPMTTLSGVGSPSWRNSQLVMPPPNPEPSLPLPPVPPTPPPPPPLNLEAAVSVTSDTVPAQPVPRHPDQMDDPISHVSLSPPRRSSTKSPPTSPPLRLIIPSSPKQSMLAPPRRQGSGSTGSGPDRSRPSSTYSGQTSAPGTPSGHKKGSSVSHSASVVAARRRSRRTSQSSLRLPKNSMGADGAPPVPQMPAQFSAVTPGDGASLAAPQPSKNPRASSGSNDFLAVHRESDIFASIITPQLANTLKDYTVSGSEPGTPGIRRRTSMGGYPYADSIKQYKRKNTQGLVDISDGEESIGDGAGRTKDDIGVFVSSATENIPSIWRTADSTRPPAHTMAHHYHYHKHSNNLFFTQAGDVSSDSSQTSYPHAHQLPTHHSRSASGNDYLYPYSPQQLDSATYEQDPSNLRPVRPELKSTFSTPSNSPSSPRLSRPLGLAGLFLSGNNSNASGSSSRELTFTTPSSSASTSAAGPSAGPSRSMNSTGVPPNTPPSGIGMVGGSGKRNSTYSKLKTLTKRYSMSINPFHSGTPQANLSFDSPPPSKLSQSAVQQSTRLGSSSDRPFSTVNEEDEEMISSPVSSLRTRSMGRSMSGDIVLDITRQSSEAGGGRRSFEIS